MKVIIIKGERVNLSKFQSWQLISNNRIYFEGIRRDLEIKLDSEQEAIETIKKIDLLVGSTDLSKMKI